MTIKPDHELMKRGNRLATMHIYNATWLKSCGDDDDDADATNPSHVYRSEDSKWNHFWSSIIGNQNSSQPAQCGTSNIFRYQNHAVSAPHSAALWRSHLHDAHHLISGFHRHRILREWKLARQTPKQCVVGILKGKAGKGGKDCKAWYSIKVVSGRRDTRLDSESSLCEHLCKNSAQDINPFVMQ